MRRLSRLVLLLVAFALVAAACGDDDDVAATPAATTAAPDAATTAAPNATTAAPVVTTAPPTVDTAEAVTLIVPPDLSGNVPSEELNAAFVEMFPNVTLDFGMGFWDSHDEPAFLAAAANRSVNDVLTGGDEYPDTYGPRGIFLDLRPFLEADADLWFNESKFQSWWIYDNPGDGAIYSVPMAGNPMVLWYNPELLAAAGLEPPPTTYAEAGYSEWTWAKFREYADALSGVVKWPVGMENNILLYGPLAASNGGALINDDASEYLIDDPAVVETLEFLTSFTLDGLAPDPTGAQDLGGVDVLFQEGEIAMWIGGAWNTGAYVELDLGFTPSIATVPHNGVTTGIVNCPASRMGISAFYEHPEVAYEYMKFVNFTAWDNPSLISSTAVFSPWSNVYPRHDVWSDIVATGAVSTGAYGPNQQDLSFLTNDHCGKTQTLADPPWYGPFLEVRDITLSEMDLVFSGGQTAAEAAASIKNQADAVIARFNRGN